MQWVYGAFAVIWAVSLAAFIAGMYEPTKFYIGFAMFVTFAYFMDSALRTEAK